MTISEINDFCSHNNCFKEQTISGFRYLVKLTQSLDTLYDFTHENKRFCNFWVVTNTTAYGDMMWKIAFKFAPGV